MVQRTGGTRRKSRHKFRKNVRTKGKISLSKYFQSFIPGQRVCLKSEPAVQKGMYHARYHGKSGKIVKKQGNCYFVQIKDKNKIKNLLVHPIHLKKI